MFDLNAIVNAALQQAVAEAIKPLVERITALENNPAIGTDTVLAERVKVLEERPAVHIDEAKMVEALNSQEWFWEKLRRTTDAQIEQAMDDHCSAYNHNDYDNVYSEWGGESVGDFVKEGDLGETVREQVEEALNNATFSVSI
jgi:hypothetical protein